MLQTDRKYFQTLETNNSTHHSEVSGGDHQKHQSGLRHQNSESPPKYCMSLCQKHNFVTCLFCLTQLTSTVQYSIVQYYTCSGGGEVELPLSPHVHPLRHHGYWVRNAKEYKVDGR